MSNNHLLDRLIIPQGGYRTIVADPPWQYGKWGKASVAPRGSSYEPRLELFARRERPGWYVWGNEVHQQDDTLRMLGIE